MSGGKVTDAGIRTNASVGIRYLASWLTGTGAAAIDNLMEDAATAEISRSQLWQWTRHAVRTEAGQPVTPELVRSVADDVMAEIRDSIGEEAFEIGRFAEARGLFEQVALAPEFIEFLTLPAYELID